MSKTFAGYHVVFCTKHRKRTLTFEERKSLYKYIYETLKQNGCHVYRINGMDEHIHIAFDLNPMVALAILIKDLKQFSSLWLKRNEKFPVFEGWQEGYYAHTFSYKDKDSVIKYITDQQVHHKDFMLFQEMQHIAERNGLTWFPDDWT